MIHRFFALFATILLIAATIVDTASAMAVDDDFYDENFYSLNNIGWYDPRCTPDSSNTYVQLAGKDATEKILNFFMRKGLTLAQASGIVGNMMQESGLNPAIIQGGRIADDTYVLQSGVGFGLVQWTSGGRQQTFMKFMKDLGVGVTDLSGQLAFVWKEMSESYPHTLRALKASKNPVDAAIAVHGPPSPGYEASADSPAAVRSVRGGNAQKVHDTYADAPALAGSTADSAMSPAGEGNETPADTVATQDNTSDKNCSDNNNNVTGDLGQLALQYAWHEFVAPGTSKQIDGKTVTATTQRPAYTAAVGKAVKEGRYVGGANGNDCGGFVTTLIYDSGFDKKYNSSAKGGNTISQEAWLRQNWKQVSSTDAKDRQPGDVAINEDHTYIYVGKVSGFNSQIASASYSDRAPMAGKEGVTDGSFRWYRKK
ncbi:MAG: phage tail tip lysozyme [Candidatus Saccharimonadales bacterium]